MKAKLIVGSIAYDSIRGLLLLFILGSNRPRPVARIPKRLRFCGLTYCRMAAKVVRWS